MPCKICDDTGVLVKRKEDGTATASPCECQISVRLDARVRRAQIPDRYKDKTLESYRHGDQPQLFRAYGMARKYVAEWSPATRTGLLFTGSVGTGKTHLASAILRQLVTQHQARGYFCDVSELLKTLQHSYGNAGPGRISERDILTPALQSDVIVLDELGAARITDWTFEIIEHVINTRYNQQRPTLITTNYAFHAPATNIRVLGPNEYMRSASAAAHVETLADRIGARMMSRLHEMVEVIEMQGPDYRVRNRA